MNYTGSIERSLSPELWHLIVLLGEMGAARQQPLYLVGGRVRDLMLGKASGDLDLVVEGDAVALARALAEAQGGEVVIHERFGTARYRRGVLSIDLATARSEVYPRPGALPVVRPGTMDADLERRDFTINAMAIRLSPPGLGGLLDPFNGQGDLKGGLIRVLHERSFVDDATRIMRAIRYEQRLAFRLEDKTLAYLRRDLAHLDTVGVDRLRHELVLILAEEKPEQALRRASDLGVLDRIHPSLAAGAWVVSAFQKAREEAALVKPGVYLALLLYKMDLEEARGLMRRYRFPREQSQVVEDVQELKSLRGRLGARDIRPSQVYDLLSGHAPEAMQAFHTASDSPQVRARIEDFLDKLRHVKPHLSGHELKSLGVPAGPEMGQILEKLLKARLDGEASTREEEAALVRSWTAGGAPG